MSHPRTRTAWLLAWIGLVLFALRPVAPVEAAAARIASPLRYLAELASPLELVRTAEVRAAERRLSSAAQEEAEENRRLVSALARFAEPSESELRAGRRLVHAEVLGRIPGNRDRLSVLLTDARGVGEGLPVASGNAYVGRVFRVLGQRADGRTVAEVELVTARGFHVGARVSGGPGGPGGPGGTDVFMTVGGIDSQGSRLRRTERRVRLAVQNPSDRELTGGLARVHELFEDAEVHSGLSSGLRLGQVRYEDERWTIEPEIDYVDGLFQLVVLAPPGELPPIAPPSDVLLDENWVQASPVGLGDPSPWREAAKVKAGTRDGVREGAAVIAIGARFLGRVQSAGPWSADVSFLGDPGFSVVAVARLPGRDEPVVLGRLVSLGRDSEAGFIRFRWVPRVAMDLADGDVGKRPALLFTGSGDSGLQSGFFLGEARLPARVEVGEPAEIRLFSDVRPHSVRSLFVRTASHEDLPVRRVPLYCWVLLVVWTAWLFALQGLVATAPGIGAWAPELGIVLLLALDGRVPFARLWVAAILVSCVRIAFSTDSPFAVLAGYLALAGVLGALREILEIDNAARTLLAVVAVLALTGFWTLCRRLALLELGIFAPDAELAWRSAMATGISAFFLMPLLIRLPGLPPLWRGRGGFAVRKGPWA